MVVTKLRERNAAGYIIHAGRHDGLDMTLCGYAEEGECADDGGDEGLTEVFRGKVDCPECVGIILYCKSIPAKTFHKAKP